MSDRVPDGLTVDAGEGLHLHATVVRSPATGTDDRDVVLLVHGFTGTSGTWRRLTAVVSEVADVIAPDLPGHGRSSSPADPARYALDRLAGDLATVLDAANVRRAIVLGYSMGGRAALKFALRYPDRATALVLESTSPGIPGEAERAARRQSDRALAEMIEREGITAFVDHWERLPLWASQSGLDSWTRGELRAQRLAQSPRGLANSLRGAGQGEDAPVRDRLGDFRCPVLLIAGALDATYVGFARDMAGRMADARLEVVPDAGHAVHLERPAEYAALVKSFVVQNSFRRRAPARGTVSGD